MSLAKTISSKSRSIAMLVVALFLTGTMAQAQDCRQLGSIKEMQNCTDIEFMQVHEAMEIFVSEAQFLIMEHEASMPEDQRVLEISFQETQELWESYSDTHCRMLVVFQSATDKAGLRETECWIDMINLRALEIDLLFPEAKK